MIRNFRSRKKQSMKYAHKIIEWQLDCSTETRKMTEALIIFNGWRRRKREKSLVIEKRNDKRGGMERKAQKDRNRRMEERMGGKSAFNHFSAYLCSDSFVFSDSSRFFLISSPPSDMSFNLTVFYSVHDAFLSFYSPLALLSPCLPAAKQRQLAIYTTGDAIRAYEAGDGALCEK